MKKLFVIISVLILSACIKTLPVVKVAEEPMVQDCEYVDTISETVDSGKLWANHRHNESQNEILRRAGNLGATHVVWVYNYRMGSAAVAYRCDH